MERQQFPMTIAIDNLDNLDKETKLQITEKTVFQKRSDGELFIDGKKVVLFSPQNRKELKDKQTLNVRFMDAFLKNQQLIPGEWKDKDIYFWNVFNRGNDEFVPFIYFDSCTNKYDWGDRYIGDGDELNEKYFVACFES